MQNYNSIFSLNFYSKLIQLIFPHFYLQMAGRKTIKSNFSLKNIFVFINSKISLKNIFILFPLLVYVMFFSKTLNAFFFFNKIYKYLASLDKHSNPNDPVPAYKSRMFDFQIVIKFCLNELRD